jgi:bis(5'-nucleosyl)-tetraphosphatase (symmetrical)
MSVYAIGDLQGCYKEFRALLKEIGFRKKKDRLWLVGDLVNRGPASLESIRYVQDLGERAVTVLGNHDLHLIALSYGNTKHGNDSSLQAVLDAADCDDLIKWLRRLPLMHHDPELDFAMVHAGLPPQWTLKAAKKHAAEVAKVLRGAAVENFCQNMYGNRPNTWSDELLGVDRLRYITNCLTRLRYCDRQGRLLLKEKLAPGQQSAGAIPWFQMPGRKTAKQRIVFGHWATLGYRRHQRAWGIDSGCVWGGLLTAIKLSAGKSPSKTQVRCKGELQPPLD